MSSTVSTVREEPAPEDDVLTSTPARALRRRALPIVVVALVVLVAIALVLIHSAATASKDPFDTTNPAPQGSRALAQVLEQQGVRVVATDSLRTTRRAIDSPADTTVLVYDPNGTMSSAQRTAVLDLGVDVVVVEPGLLDLDDYAPSVGLAGTVSGRYPADCSVTAVEKAGTVRGSGLGYRVAAADSGGDSGGSALGCLTRSGVSGLVELANGQHSLTILGLGSTLQNGTIARDGNAALALNLLGRHPELVWYISSYADLQTTGATQTIAELTPIWVTPLIAMLLIAGLAALVWRGRRFGPIVVENLPVVVRASETMEGRARLYSRANARLRALDALRIGTIDRLAKLTGLPRTTTVDEVIDTIAALLERDRGVVASLLLDAIPENDAALVHFSDLLLTLERDAAAAVIA